MTKQTLHLYFPANATAQMSRDMTKPTKWLCAQRRLRSAWTSAQSDQSLRCALTPRLIWVLAGRTVLSWGGANVCRKSCTNIKKSLCKQLTEYKNCSWVWYADRKIRPEVPCSHHKQNNDPKDRFFSSHHTAMTDSSLFHTFKFPMFISLDLLF